MSDDYISIGEAAEIANISTRTIRHYELIGLVFAKKRGRIRYFTNSTIQQLHLIGKLRQLGFSLSEIGALLNKKLVPAADFKPDLQEFRYSDFIDRLDEIKALVSYVEAILNNKFK